MLSILWQLGILEESLQLLKNLEKNKEDLSTYALLHDLAKYTVTPKQ